MSVTVVAAAVTHHVRPNNTEFSEITCPYCKKKQRYDDIPKIETASILHECYSVTGKLSKIFFMNGFAFTGVAEYNAAEKISRAVQ